MTESILLTIKKLLGLTPEYTSFDMDVIIAINTSLAVLKQIGIGPTEGLVITDDSTTWAELIGTNGTEFEMVKSYVYLKTKSLFDPPLTNTLIEAYNKNLAELEWRLSILNSSRR